MVSALMMSGAIPTLMYYGFGLISPTYFYFSAFALCSVIGVSIGSSLTACATVGVAFMGMAAAFHTDMAMTAGAIVSGVFSAIKCPRFPTPRAFPRPSSVSTCLNTSKHDVHHHPRVAYQRGTDALASSQRRRAGFEQRRILPQPA